MLITGKNKKKKRIRSLYSFCTARAHPDTRYKRHYLPSDVWIIFTIDLNSSGSFRWLWWNDSLGLVSNRIPSGTDIPSLFSIFSAKRSAWNAESGILPPKNGNTFSRKSCRFCWKQTIRSFTITTTRAIWL